LENTKNRKKNAVEILMITKKIRGRWLALF
jgi:hypothetical protein